MRSIAPTSYASSTTQSSDVSRRGLEHTSQSSCSEKFPQTSHARTLSARSTSDRARRRVSSFDPFMRWWTRRRAVLEPIPGRRDSSSVRRSIADMARDQKSFGRPGMFIGRPPVAFRISASYSLCALFCASLMAARTRSCRARRAAGPQRAGHLTPPASFRLAHNPRRSIHARRAGVAEW